MRRFLCLLLLLLFPLVPAPAETITALSVHITDTAYVHWHKQRGSYALCLPAGVDCSALRIALEGASHFTANGKTVASGSVTDVFTTPPPVIVLSISISAAIRIPFSFSRLKTLPPSF